MDKKYSFNIIHDNTDTSFARQLAQSLSKKFNVKDGFCSYNRRSGQHILHAAAEEIKASAINICIVQPHISEITRSIFRNAVHVSQIDHTLEQFIFVAHKGTLESTVKKDYLLYTGGQIIEFAMENDPAAMNSLHQSVARLLQHHNSQIGQARMVDNNADRYSMQNQLNQSYDVHSQNVPDMYHGHNILKYRNQHDGVPHYGCPTNESLTSSSTVPLPGSFTSSLLPQLDENKCVGIQPHSYTVTKNRNISDKIEYSANQFHALNSSLKPSIDIRTQSTSYPVMHSNTNSMEHQVSSVSSSSYEKNENNFWDAVRDIADELNKSEFSSLKFYFKGSISENISEELDQFKFLCCLLQEKVVTVKFPGSLLDILILLDRNDLATQLKRACAVPTEYLWRPRKTYTNMLFRVASEIDEDDFRKLKQHLITSLRGKKNIIETCKSALDLVCFLEKEGKIKKHNCKYDAEEISTEYAETYDYLIGIRKYLNCHEQIKQHVNEWYLVLCEHVCVDGPEESLQSNSLERSLLDVRSYEELKKQFLKKDLSLMVDDDGLKHIRYKDMILYFDIHKKDLILGEGGFGIVHRGIKKYKGVDIAIKRNIHDLASRKQLVKEKAIAYVKHPFLLPLIAITDDIYMGRFLLMYPLMTNGDLAKVLENKTLQNSDDFIRILWQTSCAINFLHQDVGIRHPIRHGDIKPSNILLDENLNARLGDTGLAEEMDYGRSHFTASNAAGTPTFRDPDITGHEEGKLHLKPANDIYSFGIVIAQVLLQKSEKSMVSLPVIVGRNGWSDYLNQHFDSSLWNEVKCRILTGLVQKCVHPITKRPSSSQIRKELQAIADKSNVLHPKLNKEKCIQCLVNNVFPIPATCGCKLFCQTCFKTSFRNPLDCPNCLRFTEPPIGHSNYFAVLIGAPDRNTDTFINDMEEVYKTITDPHIMGIRAQNIYRLSNIHEEKDQQWKASEENFDKVFTEIKSRSYNEKADVTLMIYISCHADKEKFQIAYGEFITREQLKTKLTDLHFKYLLLVCDCCYSGHTSVPGWIDFENSFVSNGCVSGDVNVQAESHIKCNSDWHPVFPGEDPCIYQLASCGTNQRSFFVNGNSIFTQYFISGLRSGHGCRLSESESTMECRTCEDFRRKNTEYITVSSLHEYIHGHMLRDPYAKGQKANKKEESNDSLKVAYYNPVKPTYSVHFQHSLLCNGFETGTELLKLERHPISYGSMAVLKRHLWVQLETNYKELDAEFLQVGLMAYSNGKEVFREENKIVEKFSQNDTYCQIRSDAMYLFKDRPIACELDFLYSSKFSIFLENPLSEDWNCVEKVLDKRHDGSFSCTIKLKREHHNVLSYMQKHITEEYQKAAKIIEILKQVPERDEHFSGIIELCLYQRCTTIKIKN